MATYKHLQAHVKEQTGRTPETCWSADVNARHGLTARVSPNRQGDDRRYPCPVDMVGPIEDALRQYRIL